MDVRTLACFVAVAEELHFHRAAARVHLTQPALSMRVKALEEEIGTRLLERDRRGVSLTPAGTAFLVHARAAVRHAAEAKADALSAARGETGRLRLGFTAIAFYRALPEAVRALRESNPGLVVELSEMTSPKQETALLAGDLDLGILHPPLDRPGLSIQELLPEDLVLALPACHRLAAERRELVISDLKDEPFLISPRRVGPHLYDRIIHLFRDAGLSPRIVQEAMPMPTLIGLVAAGIGMGFVARSLSVIRRPGVIYKPLAAAVRGSAALDLPFAAAWRADAGLSPVTARFVEIISSHASRPLLRRRPALSHRARH